MRKYGLILLTMMSFSALASQDVIECVFNITGNETDIEKLEVSKYKTSFTLGYGSTHQEEIKVRRLILVPDEDDKKEQKRKALEDVIFLFEKDKRENWSVIKEELDDEDIIKTGSVKISDSIQLRASKRGSGNINVLVTDDNGTRMNFNIKEYGTSNRKTTFGTTNGFIPFPLDLRTNRSPFINVKYKQYETPVFGRNKVKTKSKRLPINFHCLKTTTDKINNSEFNKDLRSEEETLDRLFDDSEASEVIEY